MFTIQMIRSSLLELLLKITEAGFEPAPLQKRLRPERSAIDLSAIPS